MRTFLAVLVFVWGSIAGPDTAGAVSPDAILAEKPPKLLSEFELFADLTRQIPARGVLPYSITTALFSDHADKYRFVFVPPGTSARYDETESFEFPVGTALIKTFAFPGGTAGPDGDLRLIETRLLLRNADGWQAWAYLWNDAQDDAVLKLIGARVPVAFQGPDGEPLAFDYSVPNKNQCKGCHSFDGAITPIGPKARNLNREFAYADGTRNQLVSWSEAGILSGAPAPEGAPAVPDWRDETEPLDRRARAWLDVNCAHCHRHEGPASNSGLFLTYGETDPVALGIDKRPVAAGRGSGGLDFDIVPGAPDESILLFRVESTEPGIMMPELGRSQADHAAVELLREWIATMR